MGARKTDCRARPSDMFDGALFVHRHDIISWSLGHKPGRSSARPQMQWNGSHDLRFGHARGKRRKRLGTFEQVHGDTIQRCRT
jgi:hypothetical protein